MIDLYHARVKLSASETHAPKAHQDIQHALTLRSEDPLLWAEKGTTEFYTRRFKFVEDSFRKAEQCKVQIEPSYEKSIL